MEEKIFIYYNFLFHLNFLTELKEYLQLDGIITTVTMASVSKRGSE